MLLGRVRLGKDDWPRVEARHRLDDLVRQQLAQVRVKSLLQRVWLPPDYLGPTAGPTSKGTVYGLDGHRSNFVII